MQGALKVINANPKFACLDLMKKTNGSKVVFKKLASACCCFLRDLLLSINILHLI